MLRGRLSGIYSRKIRSAFTRRKDVIGITDAGRSICAFAQRRRGAASPRIYAHRKPWAVERSADLLQSKIPSVVALGIYYCYVVFLLIPDREMVAWWRRFARFFDRGKGSMNHVRLVIEGR